MLESRENVRNRILYTGQQYDQETMQYYLRVRYYNPVMYYDPSGYAQNAKCTGSEVKEQEDTGITEKSRTNWGGEHAPGNVKHNNAKHNNAIETELDDAFEAGATDIRKNRVQRDAEGNRVYSNGSYTKPDASYVKDGVRYNTNYISNFELNDVSELNRELDTFNKMLDADPDAVTRLVFKY